MSVETGVVLNVSVVTLGSEITAGVSIGATSITLLDAADFSEDGGTILIGDDVGELVGYSALDDDTGVMLLVAPLASAYAASAKVLKYPLSVEKFADVQIDGEGDAVEAVVPVSIYDRLDEGARDDATAEQVRIEKPDSSDTYTVVDILGAEPLTDGSFIDPGSTIPPPALSDGIPPLVAPTSVAAAAFAIRAGRITWQDPGNPDPLHYKVYVKNATGVTTADESLTTYQLHADVLKYAGAPLDPAVTYYAKVSALDADGEGPLSSEVSFTPRQADNTDLSADEVFAIKVEAAGIQTGTLGADIAVAGSLYVSDYDADTGLPVPGTEKFVVNGDGSVRGFDGLGVERLTLDPATGSFVFRGDGEFDHLTVINGSIQGGANEIAEGATLTLEKGVTDPKNPPSVLIDYASVQFAAVAAPRSGVTPDSTTGWYVAAQTGASTYDVLHYNAAGVLLASLGTHAGICTSIVRADSTHIYVLSANVSAGASHQVDRWTDAGGYQDSSDWVHKDGPSIPVIGFDTVAAEILIAQSRNSNANKVRVRRYTYHAAAPLDNSVTSPVDCTTAYNHDLAAVMYGSFDFGASRYVFMKTGAAGAVQSMTTAGVETAADEFPTSAVIVGMHWDGTNFYSLDTSGVLRKYEAGSGNRWTTTSTDENWYAAYTWYRATGTLETLRSPYTAFTMKKRARVTIQTPNLPSSSATPPSEARVYLKKGVSSPGTNPATVNMTRQASTAGTPPTLLVVNATFAANNNPAANGFGSGGTSALLASADGSTLLSANDTDQAWTPVVTASSTNPTGYTTTGSRYKVDADRWATIEVMVTLGAGAYAGQVSVSLPFALLNRRAMYDGTFYDSSAANYYRIAGSVDVPAKDSLLLWADAATAGINVRAFNASVPIAPGSGDVIHFSIRAQKA